MLQQLRLFLTALQYFTRIPVPVWVGHSAQQLDQSARYFPLVGMGVGAIAAAVLCVSAWILPLTLAVVLSMITSILITGAFHEDGLSDYSDGMGGGYTPEKILAIMKDSHVGSYGVIAIVLALLIKFQILLLLSNKHSLVFVAVALISSHGISRLMAVSIMLTQQYVRVDDTARAKPVAQGLSRTSFAIAGVTGLAAIAFLIMAGGSYMNIVIALVGSLIMRIYLGQQMLKKLGGYTGDCLGAVQQLSEIAFYLGLLAALPQ